MRLISVMLALALLLIAMSPTIAQEQSADPDALPAEEIPLEIEPTPVPLITPVPTQAPTPTPIPVLSEADVAERVAPSIVRIVAGTAQGSGVKIDRGVLTNEHVVAGASRIEVVTADGSRTTAVLSRSSRRFDLALLLTEASIPALELEPARAQRQGDTVLALGYPRTDVLGAGQPTLTRGLLSAFREDQDGVVYVQTDAALNAGSSGGALVNMRGKLIGITTASVRESEALGVAVATESVQAFLTGPEETSTRPPALPRAPGAGDPVGSIIGQTTTVCEGGLRLELRVEDATMARDGTTHLLVQTRNTGNVGGNLLLKVRLTDDRGRSFNMVNPRDRFILGDIYAEILGYLRRNGIDAIGPDVTIRPGTTASVYLAFLSSSDAMALRLVPDSPCG